MKKEPEDIWLEKAENLKKSKKFEESIKLLDRARDFKEEKRGVNYWFQRGIALTEVRKYEEAIDCFEKDLKLNKPSFETFYEKAIVLYTVKKYQEAVECFNKAWEIKHANFLKLSDQANTLKNHKKFEKSVLYADRAKNVTPIPPKFWHYKGLALHEMKKYDEAIESYRESMNISTDDAEIIYDLSKSHLQCGEIDKCLELLDRACKLDSDKRKRLLVDPSFEKLSNNPKFRDIRDYDRLPTR
jgi:protein O-GlcNAc transferase